MPSPFVRPATLRPAAQLSLLQPRPTSSLWETRAQLSRRVRQNTTATTRLMSSKPRAWDREGLPLEGITVVSLEQAISAPFCTRQLAEMGARVIKVERRGEGDFARGYDRRVRGQSSHFVWTNRSKESLELDVKNPKDRRVLGELIERADVLVQNLAPGAASRLGLSYNKLKRENPGLIVCNISGYGSDGPYRDKKAYDLLVQSEAGLLSVTGSESEPAKVGISVADIAAGTSALQNILAALMRRGRTGKGSHIDVSMLEAMAEWMSYPMYYAFDGAEPPTREGASHASIYPYGPFDTKTTPVMIGIQNEREWVALCTEVLGDPALAYDGRFADNTLRSQNRVELRDIIHGAFSKLSAEEVLAKLDASEIANAKVNSMQDLWDHPQLEARGRWTEVDTPQGKIPALKPAGITDDSLYRMGPVPSVGQHNQKIIEELGLTDYEDRK